MSRAKSDPKCPRCHKGKAVYRTGGGWWYCYLCPCYFPLCASFRAAVK